MKDISTSVVTKRITLVEFPQSIFVPRTICHFSYTEQVFENVCSGIVQFVGGSGNHPICDI